MYIKQVVIEGFKSYREQIATDNFSPKVNCIVGANGSGKSNFFHAIRFVISDLFHNLRNEERQALLHEGAGHQVLSAFVEIVFDNSDNRIPVDKEEVRLRRTIGVKKDEYFLDGIRITKTEVENLLESAGFSRSNPYYVVQQGKIASLTLMKDSERLELLKEIGGTGVYEEGRRKSLKIMQETGKRRKQIIQDVEYLNDRLQKLDEEKEELKKYQQLDRQRKSLEYTIYDKELNDAKQQLTKIDEDRRKISEKSATMYNSVSDAHKECKKLDKSLKNLTKDAQSLSREKESIETQRTAAIMKCAELELDDKDLQDKIRGNIRNKDDADEQLVRLEKEILESDAELAKINQFYDEQVKEEDNLALRIMEREKQLSILYQKRGRATHFKDKAARDQWLTEEIKEYEQVLSTNQAQEKNLREEIEQLKKDIINQDAYIKEQNDEAAKSESLISGYRENYSQYKLDRDRSHDKRKFLWGDESELSSEIDRLKSEVIKAEKSLNHATPLDIRRGLQSEKIKNKIGGVYGPIIELLDCDEKYFAAVEVTAGNSLFHVVVENDDISTEIIKHLDAEKGGRVTFIPLNRVRAPQVTYPQSSYVEPLLGKLKFLEEYRAAFGQVFAKTVICTDLDVATRVARTDGLDCITLEGDQVNKNGGMTGGFYDYKRSKLKFQRTIRENKNSVRMKEQELTTIRKELEETDREINELMAELQKCDAELAKEKFLLEQLKEDTKNAEKKNRSISKSLEKKEKLLASKLSQINQDKANIDAKAAEMGTELVDQLTKEEKEFLSWLNTEITRLKEQLITCRSKTMEAKTRKSEQMNLSTNLVRRKGELETVKQSTDEMLQGEAKLKKELEDANSVVDDLTQQLEGVTECIKQKNLEFKNIEAEKDILKSSEDKNQSTLQDLETELEQLLSNRNFYLAKQQEYSKKIWELGPRSSDGFGTYKGENIKELHKQLYICNEQLQQFNHVNKKALDQYARIYEQKEELQERRAKLDADDKDIKELISALDMRKDESIERTFKGVAKHFREVFSELVPGGHGFLVMMKKKDNIEGADNDQDDDEPRPSEGSVDRYIGVKVKVSFNGQGETQSMKQLSGGQKTVVALALIFAIQRCDPAPFYLFDEIDAALDHQYRTAVGNMIRRLADMTNTQFITTTFRRELVRVADKIYGVTHKNRVSRINIVSQEEALDFIEHDQSHNEL